MVHIPQHNDNQAYNQTALSSLKNIFFILTVGLNTKTSFAFDWFSENV